MQKQRLRKEWKKAQEEAQAKQLQEAEENPKTPREQDPEPEQVEHVPEEGRRRRRTFSITTTSRTCPRFSPLTPTFEAIEIASPRSASPEPPPPAPVTATTT